MHTVYHTDAFILKSLPVGEANRRVWLFTKDFGLVVAVVQGVRKPGAKLQMQLSDYSLVSVDIIRGREVWRLVSLSELKSPLISKDVNGLGRVFVRTLSAVERFCHGEDTNEILFQHLVDCIEALTYKELDERSFDTVSLWKIMVALGYIAVEEKDKVLFEMSFVDAVKSVDETTRTRLIKETNNTITQTHL